jgi:hypothetical protein
MTRAAQSAKPMRVNKKNLNYASFPIIHINTIPRTEYAPVKYEVYKPAPFGDGNREGANEHLKYKSLGVLS